MSWPVLPHGFLGSQAATGDQDTYQIQRSLRFNSADNAHLIRTMGTPTSQTTATLSLWVKRSGVSKSNFGDSFWCAEASNYNLFAFSGSGGGNTDTLQFSFRNGGTYYSNAVYRDPSAWYHIVCVYDSTNATQSERFRFFVNGVRGTFISAPAFALNYTFEGSIGAGAYRIGDFSANSSWRPDFYLAEYYWIDGQALSPSSFGETDPITGRWKAKAYTGTYGNNGFYLKFADNSGTTSTTLGKDSSPNGNNWTPNNFSVTAGAGNDSLVDSPTNYGTDTGVGGEVRGNYPTWNPLEAGGNGTFLDGNLLATAANLGSTANPVHSSFSFPASGKWYCEVTGVSVGSQTTGIGIALNTSKARDTNSSYYAPLGNKYINGTNTSYGASWTNNDIIGVALNMDAGTVVMYKNNVSQGTLNSGLSGQYDLVLAGGGAQTIQCYVNFGQRPFAYAAPTGFRSLCTTNLPTPTIQKPSNYMDVVTYTGNGSTQTISSLGFSPDFLWSKSRSVGRSHRLIDSVRGIDNVLVSDTTAAEYTGSAISSFNSNGFSLKNADNYNVNSETYVAWAWDEAPIAGMDIVSFTAPSSGNTTISHSLGVTPRMIIAKSRNSSTSWTVYHASATTKDQYLFLNTTNAVQTLTDVWGSAAPTSSVFGFNSNNQGASASVIAYLFAEVEGFSKFGSYTGNGSADGPFVWCGFRPRYIIFKRSDTTGNWYTYDAARNSFNGIDLELSKDLSSAETNAGGVTLDFVSNGFKLRRSGAVTNASGGTHLFAAFAESPFKYARAR